MKNIIVAAACFLILLSCKKEGGGGHPKETLIAEVLRNGLPNPKFAYNSDNLLTKLEAFSTDTSNPVQTSTLTFKYNSKGHITELTAFIMPANLAGAKAVIEYDAEGRLSKAYSYDLQGISPNTPQSTSTYTYNDKNLVIKIVDKDKNDKLIGQTNLLYFADGHLKERQSWKQSDDQLWMSGKTSYSAPSGTYPNGLEQLRVILGTDFIAGMYSDVIVRLTYSQAGVIMKHSSEQMSNREWNEDGTLKRQTVTLRYIKPEQDDDVDVEEYIYIKQ